MYTLRCTRKLLTRLRSTPVETPPAPTTVLGDWYANVVTLRRRPFVLAVSERTFLAAVVTLAPSRSLRDRLRVHVGDVLCQLSIDPEHIERETAMMSESALGRTASRTVVGVMVDFAWQLEAGAQSGDDLDDTLALSLRLATTPCGPLKMDAPNRVSQALFAQL